MERTKVNTMEKVRALRVLPDPDDKHLRLDRLGDFDYSSGMFLKLWTNTPNATIYYALNELDGETGALPEGKAPIFQLYESGLGVAIPRVSVPEKEPLVKKYALKAYAVCPGMENSEVLERVFTITHKPYTETVISKQRDAYGIVREDAWNLHDYDNDNMYLYNGSEAALLFDTGFYAPGNDLYGRVRAIIGEEKLLYVVHSHNGPDHIQMTWQFVNKPNTKIYINNRDRYMLDEHVRTMLSLENTPETQEFLDRFIFHVKDGDVFDLGNMRFRTLEMPGHTFGHIAILEEVSGDFLVGDCIGSTTVLSEAALWMWNIVPRVPLNDYLSILLIFRERIKKLNIRNVYTGHNARAIPGADLSVYLHNLKVCTENFIDYGVSRTKIGRTFPPFAYVAQASHGDTLTDEYTAGIVTSMDLMFEPEYLNGNDGKNCDLSYLDVRTSPEGDNLLLTQESGLGISLNFQYNDVIPSPKETLEKSRTRIEHPEFDVSVEADVEKLYVMPVTNSHYSRVFINGARADSTYLHITELEKTGATEIHMQCISEDGSEARDYTIHANRKR